MAMSLLLSLEFLSIISDVYAVILPSIMLRHYDLDIPRRQKIGLNIIFGLGLVVAGCGVARTYYLWRINQYVSSSMRRYVNTVHMLIQLQHLRYLLDGIQPFRVVSA